MFSTSRFQNTMSASAACAEASSCCASSAANNSTLILDAIILASMSGILGLVLRAVILSVCLILAVLVVLVCVKQQNMVKSVPTA